MGIAAEALAATAEAAASASVSVLVTAAEFRFQPVLSNRFTVVLFITPQGTFITYPYVERDATTTGIILSIPRVAITTKVNSF